MELCAVTQEVLRTDVAGMPLEWIDYRDAVRLYHTEQVAYACGCLILEKRIARGTAITLNNLVAVLIVSNFRMRKSTRKTNSNRSSRH